MESKFTIPQDRTLAWEFLYVSDKVIDSSSLEFGL